MIDPNMTIPEIWKKIGEKLAAFKEPYANEDAIYEFQIQEGDREYVYQLELTPSSFMIYPEKRKKAGCILKMKAEHFRKFLFGEMNSTTAFMTGKLKLEGSIGLALKLEGMLKQYKL